MHSTKWVVCYVLAALSVGLGMGPSLFPREVSKVNKVVIHKPATDEQLLQFWFGEGDKQSLRKRVCGK